jgi:hypothetical protein
MKINRKNLILFIILGLMAHGIPVMAICSSNCAAGNPDLYSTMDGSCTFLCHSFFQSAILLSVIFGLPVAGLFLVRDRQTLPPGVYLLLFKPPRFSR